MISQVDLAVDLRSEQRATVQGSKKIPQPEPQDEELRKKVGLGTAYKCRSGYCI